MVNPCILDGEKPIHHKLPVFDGELSHFDDDFYVKIPWRAPRLVQVNPLTSWSSAVRLKSGAAALRRRSQRLSTRWAQGCRDGPNSIQCTVLADM